MASLIEELALVLDAENVEYQSLLQISKDKTPVIVAGDLDKLQEMVAREQVYVDKITNLEKKREEILNDIATVLGEDINTLTVRAIVKLLEGQEQEKNRLSEIHDSLKVTLNEMVMVNNMNTGLIKESLEMVDFNINLYNSLRQAPETANYSKEAFNIGHQSDAGTFDTKQ